MPDSQHRYDVLRKAIKSAFARIQDHRNRVSKLELQASKKTMQKEPEASFKRPASYIQEPDPKRNYPS